ncbi:hypothetical protein LCGC14_2685560, partial [marine sediment metagenome]
VQKFNSQRGRKPINFFTVEGWKQFGQALRTSRSQSDRSLGKKILSQPLLFVTQFISRTGELKELPAGLLALIKDPKNIKEIPGSIVEDFKGTIQLLKTSPSEGLGKVGSDIFTFKIIGGTMKMTGKVTSNVATKLRPSFRGVKTSSVGIRKIKGVKKVGDIEIIPRAGEKLKVKPLKAVKEAQIKKQLKETPKLAPTTTAEKRVLNVVKKRGDAVSGSFAQESLLKKQFTRRHKDLDILTKNRPKLIADLKKEFGKNIKFKGKKVSIEAIVNNKVIADLIDFKVGESGFAKKFGVNKVQGVNLVSQKARLASKVHQLGIGKRGKVLRDIEKLTGRRIKISKTAIEGPFGFSEKELKRLVNKRGALTTSQEDLFKSLRSQLKDSLKDLIESRRKRSVYGPGQS